MGGSGAEDKKVTLHRALDSGLRAAEAWILRVGFPGKAVADRQSERRVQGLGPEL